MSDDDHGGTAEHLANAARRQAARAQQGQQPARVTVKRLGPFGGGFSNSYWLSSAWSPDGSQLAYGGRTSDGSGILHVWNGESGHHETLSMRHLTHGVTGMVISLAWSPDSRRLVTVELNQKSGERSVQIRSQAERSRAIGLPAGLKVEQAAWSPDGALLALSGRECAQTILVDPSSGDQRRVLDNLSGPVAWEPEGRRIAGLDGTSVLLCDAATGEQVGKLAGQAHRPATFAWARHGRYLAVGDGEKIHVWDADSGTRLWNIPWTTAAGDRGPDGTVARVDWLDGGRYLLEFRPKGGAWHNEWGTTCATAILWDVEGKALFVELFSERVNNVRKSVAGLDLAPDGRRLAVALDDHPPVIWQITGDLPHYRP